MILNAHTYNSLRYGTIPPERLVELATVAGHETVAITDINSSTGTLEFAKFCQGKNVRPIAGMDFRDGERRFTAIARDLKGYREINELCTSRNLDGIVLPAQPSFENCYVIYPKDQAPAKLLEHEYIGITPEQVNKVRFEKSAVRSKLVALPEMSFEKPSDFETHRKLRAIAGNVLLSQVKPESTASAQSYFLSSKRMEQLYADLPEALDNTRSISSDCSFDFDFNNSKNKKTYSATRRDDRYLLEKLAFDGLKQRYGKNNKIAEERVRKELEIVDKLGFAAYFLIAWDTIHYSMTQGIQHVGRGSGANSVIAYCLKITDVCPIELDLYFERFLNPKREVPPDFDIDYSWKDRDQVTDYIFRRYGKQHTALLGTIGTFKDRSIIRELGKVYGLPKNEIDSLIKNPNSLLNRNEVCNEILSIYSSIESLPNMRGIHAGGILISEEPVTSYIPLELPPKGYPTAQMDMYLAEDIHLDKLDILSQRGLGHIHECVEIIERNRGVKVNVHDFIHFKKDEKIREQLRSANTIGCFYIESPAMRGLLFKLMCETYLTLVAASSIIRPGVSSSGMMKAYIERFRGKPFEYLHPLMKELLGETFGIMVYQEDVLKVGHHFGGLDLSDADVLRRMMSGKGRQSKRLEEIKEKFFAHGRLQNYPFEIVDEVWRQIASFAGYSFSKAHSASYAVESYQSLFLKTYYPLEFMVAVINNFGGFYSTRVYFNEVSKAGGKICLPCVNTSDYTTHVQGKDVYIGFVHLKSLEKNLAETIVEERDRAPFIDLADFVQRTRITLDQLVLLIRIDALRFTGEKKQHLLWKAHLLFNDKSRYNDTSMFSVPAKEFKLPELTIDPLEQVYDEIELLGFPISMSYFDLLKTEQRAPCKSLELKNHVGETVRIMGTYVCQKDLPTKYGEHMAFGTFLDDDGNFFDTVNFSDSLRQYPFTGVGVYLIMGKVVTEFDFPSIEVKKMVRLPIKADPRAA